MKRRTGVFVIFLLIIMLTACGNETKNASNQSVANLDNVKKIISKTGQKEAEITSDVDKKNIIFLLKSLSNPVYAYYQSSSKLILTVDSHSRIISEDKVNLTFYQGEIVRKMAVPYGRYFSVSKL